MYKFTVRIELTVAGQGIWARYSDGCRFEPGPSRFDFKYVSVISTCNNNKVGVQSPTSFNYTYLLFLPQNSDDRNETLSIVRWTPHMEHNGMTVTCRASHATLEHATIETSMKLDLHCKCIALEWRIHVYE